MDKISVVKNCETQGKEVSTFRGKSCEDYCSGARIKKVVQTKLLQMKMVLFESGTNVPCLVYTGTCSEENGAVPSIFYSFRHIAYLKSKLLRLSGLEGAGVYHFGIIYKIGISSVCCSSIDVINISSTKRHSEASLMPIAECKRLALQPISVALRSTNARVIRSSKRLPGARRDAKRTPTFQLL
jgi:hypothetical protein